MALFFARQSRGLTRDIQINGTQNGAAVVIVPGDNDKIRATIRAVDTDYLAVASDAPTAAGSTFTKNTPEAGKNRLRLDATDLAGLKPGFYSIVIDLFDNADGAEWKLIDVQVIVIEKG